MSQKRLVVIHFFATVLVAQVLASAGAARQPDTLTVTGLVRWPGTIAWTPGMTVDDAIERAGGMTRPQDAPEDMYERSMITRTVDGKKRQVRDVTRRTTLLVNDQLLIGRDLR